MKKIKNKELVYTVEKALGTALEKFEITDPSKKTEKLLEKVSKEFSGQLKKEVKKNTKKVAKAAKKVKKEKPAIDKLVIVTKTKPL